MLQLDFVRLPDFCQADACEPTMFWGERCFSVMTISIKHLFKWGLLF